MSGLVTDAEMAGLRAIAELGMADEVVIYTRSVGEGLEGDTQQEFNASVTVKGWLWETLASGNGDVVGGEEAITTAYRLFLPVGTPVNVGDRVVAKGETYIVLATNAENTYRPVLRCSLRRAE